MRKRNIILLSVCSGILVCAVLLVIFLNSIAGGILVWALQSATGYRVVIEGPVAFDLSMEPSLAVSEMRIESDDDDGQRLTAQFGRVRTTVALKPLVSGAVLVRELFVGDATLSFIVEDGGMPEDREEKSLREKLSHIPIVERFTLENISANYRDEASDYSLHVLLNTLSVADQRDEGPLQVIGDGTVNNHRFSLDGELGSITDAGRQSLPYPVDIRGALSDLSFQVSGTVDDPLGGKGLNLLFSADEPEVSNVLAVLNIDAPGLGHLNMEARIVGDVRAPGIADFSINVSGEPGIGLSAGGSVVNLLTGEGADVTIAASWPDIELVRAMLPQDFQDMDQFVFEGRLQNIDGDFIVENVRLSAEKQRESMLTATGRINLGRDITDRAAARGELRVNMKAKDSKLLRSLLFDWLPDTGPVSGEARLSGSVAAVSLKDINVTAGAPKRVWIHASGGVDSVPLGGELPVSGIDISLSVKADDPPQLFANLDAAVPDLKNIKGQVRMHGSADRLIFEDIAVQMTDTGEVDANVSGGFILKRGPDRTPVGLFDLNVGMSAPRLSNFSKLLAAKALPELGPVHVRAHMSGNTGVMTLEDVAIEAGEKGQVYFGWKGSIGKVTFDDQPPSDVNIVTAFSSEKTSLLSPYIGISIPDLGPIKGSSRIVSRPGGYGSDDIEYIIGDEEDYRMKATGSMEYVMRGTDVAFEGIDMSVDIRELDSFPILASLGHRADLGRISGNLSVSGDLFDLALSDVHLTAVSSGGLNISAHGAVQHIRAQGEKPFEGINAEVSANGPDLTPIKEVSGVDLPDLGPFTLHVKASDRAGAVIIEKINLLTGKKENPTLHIEGQMHDVLSREKIDFSASFEAAVSPWSRKYFEHEVPEESLIKGEAALTGTVDQFSIRGSASLGNTFIQAAVEKFGGKERPRIAATISSPKVYLDDLGLYPDVTSESQEPDKSSPQPAGRKMFAESPLPFEKLNVRDISLNVDAGEIIGKDFTLYDLDFDVTIDQGLLVIKPAGLKYAEGFVSIESTIDTRQEKPGLTLKITAEDINTEELFAYLRFPRFIEGHLNIAADLRSAGASPREIASGLNGEFGIAVENGRIRRIADVLGADAIDFVTAVYMRGGYQQLNCLALKFLFEEGIGTSEIMYSDTPEVRSVGAGTVNLREESIDLVIQPKPKKRQIGGSSPVTIKGPLSRPSVTKLPYIEAARLTGEILLPYVFLPARAMGYTWYLMNDDKDEESPCLRPLD